MDKDDESNASFERDAKIDRDAERVAVAAMPEWMGALDRYVHHRIPTGGCLRAVLANDLMQAFARADFDTTRAMGTIVRYIYNDIPSACHGSYAAVDAWLDGGRR